MLGKLLKYEMRAGMRLLPIVYLALVGFYGIGALAKWLDIPQIRITMSVLLVIGGVAAVIIAVVFVIQRYARGVFGAEGYLSQTLPVSSGNLIASKVLAAFLWMIVSIVATVVAVLGMLQLNDVKELQDLIDTVFGGNFTPLVVFTLASSFAQLFAFIGELYFAITLANTRAFQRNNALLSVVFYFVANFAVSMVEVLSMLVIPLGVNITDSGVTWTTQTMLGSFTTNFTVMDAQPLVANVSVGVGSSIADLVVGIVLLILTNWLLSKKASVK